jgi:antitoxin component YwqK of YwqJK toxin-antitoxin module
MKYCFILLVFLGISCKECKREVVVNALIPAVYHSKDSVTVSQKHDSVFWGSKPYNGFIYQLYPEKKDTFSVESYFNGVLNGITKKYYPSGQLMECRHYRNGEKDGRQISFWENGKKRFEFIAEKDAYEGELKEWSENGHLIHLAHFKKGQEEGAQQLWYDNGKIRANYVIRNGKRYGLLGTKNCKNVSEDTFVTKQ